MDVWALACVAFELCTSKYLFNPQPEEGVSKDEEHLAVVVEVLGDLPRRLVRGSRHGEEFCRRSGELRRIPDAQLRRTSLAEKLERFRGWSRARAEALRGRALELRAHLTTRGPLRAERADDPAS